MDRVLDAPSRRDEGASGSAALTIVIPSFNERDNVPELLRRLDHVLANVAWEAVIVDDDSPDRTWAVVRGIALADPRVRCIRRVGRRGLAGACIEGILASSAPVVAVMDADLQHDEAILPSMLAAIAGGADLVVGSRYVDGGSASGLSRVSAPGAVPSRPVSPRSSSA